MVADGAADRQDEWQQHAFSVEYVLPLVFTRDVFAPGNPHLRELLTLREPHRRHRMAVFADAGLLQVWPELPARIAAYEAAHAANIELVGEVVSVPGGEACKNEPALLERLLAALAARHIDRHSYAIAIGGGAVLDAVGYAAAIFHRGVRHVRLPSTVLAQGDSGIGVKNALNWQGQKNLVGSFSPPWGVINDAAFLDLLPLREKRAGLAEAVKVALIRDRRFFLAIEEEAAALAAGLAAPVAALIRRSAQLHMRQISQGGDPFERGSARPLDFGHWAAHKLERLSGHALSHGEAVAIGIALDARYSVLAGLLPTGEDARIHRLLARLGFSLWHPQLLAHTPQGQPALLAGLNEFREHLGGELSITLLSAIGEAVEVHAMDVSLVLAAAAWLLERREELARAPDSKIE